LLFSLVGFSQNSFEQGKKAFEEGDYKNTISVLTSVLKTSPSDKMTRDYLGQAYARLELWEESAEVNKTLVEDYPEDAEYHFRYGGALGLAAKEANPFKAVSLIDDVKFHLKKATELDPTHINSRWALLQMYLELPGIVGGSESTSRRYASQLETISPVDGALAFGYIERELANYNKAEMHYKKAVKLGQSVTTYKELAELYKRSNQDTLYFQTLENGIETLNSLALASVYVERTLRLNRNKSKALGILNTLNPAGLNSEEIEKLNQLKSKLD
jgi:tetratricopeptide (TPR) repeat protein